MILLKLDVSNVGSMEINLMKFTRDVIHILLSCEAKHLVKDVSFKEFLIFFQTIQRE